MHAFGPIDPIEGRLLSPLIAKEPGPAVLDVLQANIAASEYHIRFQETAGALQSPNRAQDLRITYHADGFTLTPRVEGDKWRSGLRLKGIGRDSAQFNPGSEAAITVVENTALVDHGTFVIAYTNDTSGMRQDFLLRERPTGDGPVRIELEHWGDLTAHADGEDGVLFSQRDSLGALRPMVRYRDLLAWDANNDTLHAWMEVADRRIVLAVDDALATYPITIDPLSTSAGWIGEGNQAGAFYGYSVHTAGDVNGDGRSDIIIGAPFYDGGAVNGGRAFVHHGTATGVNATPNTTITSSAAEVALGISVATAGDVNGDGYSDVVVLREEYLANGRMLYIHHGSNAGVSSSPSTSIALSAGTWISTAASAGDVNGDGYSDLIVGLPGYSSRRGRVLIYHGGAGGLSTTPALTITGTQTDAQLGVSVSSAGDVNNDGYSDVIIGENHWTNGQSEEGRFFVHHGGTGGIVATPALTYESGQAFMNLGISVSFAGDVDGDGYADVIVGASLYFDGTNTVGAAYVFYGSSAGVTTTGMDLVEGSINAEYFGWSVCSAGDVNGDGFADVVIGAPGLFSTQVGAAYAFLGSSSGVGGTPVWSVNGIQASSEFGYCVAVAGDVNGDGFSDVLVGAPKKENSGQTDEGHVTLYEGSAEGLQTPTGSLAGTQTNARFGSAVASAGDVNADGFADLLVGSPFYDAGQTDEGRTALYLGSEIGYSSSPNWIAESNQANAHFGASVGSAGDVNGDGYSDFLIGAPLYDAGESNEGRVYQYSGGTILPGPIPVWSYYGNQVDANCGTIVGPAGDVNGDGYSDVLLSMPLWDDAFTDEGTALVFHGAAAGLGLSPAWSTTGGSAAALFGTGASFAGDQDSDGYADVIIGVPTYSNGQAGEGRVLWYRGGSSGLAATHAWAYESNSVGAAFGASVSAAGDVNGDGEADFIVGAPQYTNGQTNEGRIYVFPGSTAGPGPSMFTYESGVANVFLGTVVSMAGDVNADGYADVAASHLGSSGTIFCWLGNSSGWLGFPDLSASGTQASEGHATAMANAGDVDGDGFGDLAVGSPMYNVGVFPTLTDAGRVRIYRGGANSTLSRPIAQYRTDLTTPVRTGNGTFDPGCGFGIGQVARSWMGRRKMKLAWEITWHGGTFQGTPINGNVLVTGEQGTWSTITSLTGSEIKQLVAVSGYSFPKWRVRMRHHPATMIDGQPYSRWHHFGVHDKQDPSAKVNLAACGPLPIELITFAGTCADQSIVLRWTTASERDNDRFLIQRSTDAQDWKNVATVPGSGNSMEPLAYEHIDAGAGPGQHYYRLVQVDMDGTEHVQTTIAVAGCDTANARIHVWPVPADGILYLAAPWTGAFDVRVIDATGRTIRTMAFRDQLQGTTITLPMADLPSGRYLLSCLSVDSGTAHAGFQIIH